MSVWVSRIVKFVVVVGLLVALVHIPGVLLVLHHIGNWLYKFFGLSGSGPYYAYHSASGSNWGEYVELAGAVVLVKHINCHDHGCWKIITHKVDGTPYRACRKHHPVLSKHERITAEIMKKAHEEVTGRKL